MGYRPVPRILQDSACAAPRVEGQLTSSGNALFLDYVLRLPYNEGTIDVREDDRMYRVAPNILVNESRMTRFGVQVGSILLVIVQQHNV